MLRSCWHQSGRSAGPDHSGGVEDIDFQAGAAVASRAEELGFDNQASKKKVSAIYTYKEAIAHQAYLWLLNSHAMLRNQYENNIGISAFHAFYDIVRTNTYNTYTQYYSPLTILSDL